MTGTLCDLATSLPRVVGTLLDREAKLKRGRFREETFTDVIVAALAAFAGPELIIQYPHEASTGGDVDLEFWHVRSGRRIVLRLQAKRLNAAEINGNMVTAKHRSYRELLHKVPTTGEYQFETLMNSSGPSLPLYIFYNHGSVAADPHYAAKSPPVRGINLAFAFDIVRELRTKIDAKPKVLHHKRLNHLQPFLFSLNQILCLRGEYPGRVPTPDAVSKSLQRLWLQFNSGSKSGEEARGAMQYLFQPDTMHPSPDPRRLLPNGPAIRTSDNIERNTVTFISGRTGDERTPRIVEFDRDRGA